MDSVEKFNILREEYYKIKGNNVGGKLHIILDNHNYEDNIIKYCRKLCVNGNDEKGIAICDLLSTIPYERRIWLNRNPLWEEDDFDEEYEITDDEIKPGDFVLVESDYVIFVVGSVENNLVKVISEDTKYHKSVCKKIIISQ